MAHELIERQVIFDGQRVRLEVHHLRDEITGRRFSREIVVHGGAVVILPFLDDNTILLIRNKRYAVGQVLIELPAGTLEPKEIPMNCAGRELLEETGYLAGRIKSLGTFYSSPGILSEKMYVFAAYNLQQNQPQPDEGEEIELLPVPLDQAIRMIQHGEITDGKTIATLLMYERFHRGRT